MGLISRSYIRCTSGIFSCSGSPFCVTPPNFPFGHCSSSALCPYNKGEGALHSQGPGWADDQGLTDLSMLTLGQSVLFLDGLETSDRMQLLFDWGLLGGWAVSLELLSIVCHQEGKSPYGKQSTK